MNDNKTANEQLIEAVKSFDLDAVQQAVANGADVSCKDDIVGMPVLIHAARRNRGIEIVQFFLNHGADINQKDTLGETAYTWACAMEQKEMVEFLLQQNNIDTGFNGRQFRRNPLNDPLLKYNSEKVYTNIKKALDNPLDVEELSIEDKKINLSSLSKQWHNFKNLRKLHLINCCIDTILESICELSQVVELDFSGNNIVELPDKFNSLQQLQVLGLRKNKLKYLPQSLSQLQKLEYLDLSYNVFEAFPREIIGLTKLRGLYLRNNRLKEIPDELLHCINLKSLDLTGNSKLTYIPKDIINLNLNAKSKAELRKKVFTIVEYNKNKKIS